MTSARLKPLLSGAGVVLVALLVWWTSTSSPTAEPDTTRADAIQPDATQAEDSSAQNTATAATAATPATAADRDQTDSPDAVDQSSDATPFSDLPTITRAELPPEAISTLADIAAGGPYDFSRDDSVFQNREGFLPDQAVGHYREYTVITPGSDDRGARRIVAGADGERFYTDDHYASFHEILR